MEEYERIRKNPRFVENSKEPELNRENLGKIGKNPIEYERIPEHVEEYERTRKIQENRREFEIIQ